MDDIKLSEVKSTMGKKTVNELDDILKRLEINNPPKTKEKKIEAIIDMVKDYNLYKKKKVDRFIKKEQLGNKGRESKTYLVYDKKTKNDYAMKTYRKNKSSKEIEQEYRFQQKAAEIGISPNLIDYDTINKTIVMEKMDEDLVDVIKKQKGKMTLKQQKELMEIFRSLDSVGVFHMDSNPLNFMFKEGKMYVIDYGFSKEITDKLKKKYVSENPNWDYMPISFIAQIKDYFPEGDFKYIEGKINPEAQKRICLKKI